MALTEITVLAEVAMFPQSNSINVRWDNIIQRDGEEISRVPHRKCYSQGQRDDFIAEVDEAEKYLQAMGW